MKYESWPKEQDPWCKPLKWVPGLSLRVRSSAICAELGLEPQCWKEAAERVQASGGMPHGCLPLDQAGPTGKRPRCRPGTEWKDFISSLVWKHIGISQEEMQGVMSEFSSWIFLTLSQKWRFLTGNFDDVLFQAYRSKNVILLKGEMWKQQGRRINKKVLRCFCTGINEYCFNLFTKMCSTPLSWNRSTFLFLWRWSYLNWA